MTQEKATDARRSPIATTVIAILVAAAAGFGAVYVMARGSDNLPDRNARQPTAAVPRQAQVSAESALPTGAGANLLSTGHMAAFVFKKTPEPLPDVSFVDEQGKERSLKEWRGRVVLLNLWATWCLPCRKEMPALERLQRELGSEAFEVLPVSADRSGIDGARKFFNSIKVDKLGVYADSTVRITSTLKAIGMPATILVDREGREIGRLLGPAEWDSEEAKNLVRAVVKRGARG
jgi:thiol-disulfide isomerase/thioredoxin